MYPFRVKESVHVIVRRVAKSPSYSSATLELLRIIGISALIPISGIVLTVTVNSGVK